MTLSKDVAQDNYLTADFQLKDGTWLPDGYYKSHTTVLWLHHNVLK